MKADRVPLRTLRRFDREQRKALDTIQYGDPGTADRGRCKTTLGWRRTREETVAFARVLLDGGVSRLEVGERLNVDPRYLDKLLKTPETGQNAAKNPLVSSGFMRPSDRPKVIPRPGRQMYGSDPYAYNFVAALEAVA